MMMTGTTTEAAQETEDLEDSTDVSTIMTGHHLAHHQEPHHRRHRGNVAAEEVAEEMAETEAEEVMTISMIKELVQSNVTPTRLTAYQFFLQLLHGQAGGARCSAAPRPRREGLRRVLHRHHTISLDRKRTATWTKCPPTPRAR